MKINCVLKAACRFEYDDTLYRKGDPMVIPEEVFNKFESLFQKIEDVPDKEESYDYDDGEPEPLEVEEG